MGSTVLCGLVGSENELVDKFPYGAESLNHKDFSQWKKLKIKAFKTLLFT